MDVGAALIGFGAALLASGIAYLGARRLQNEDLLPLKDCSASVITYPKSRIPSRARPGYSSSESPTTACSGREPRPNRVARAADATTARCCV